MASQFVSPGQIPDAMNSAMDEDEWRQNLSVQVMCRECQEWPPNIIEEFSSGDSVCGSCGLVLGDRIIDTRSEWRTFANDESGSDDPSRVGNAANPLLNGSQLETSISFGDGGQRSRELSRAHAKLTNSKSNKNLTEAYSRIHAICNPLGLTGDIIETTQQLFKATEDNKMFKGKNTDAIIAGCLFIACRQLGSPRTFKEINKATRVTKKEVGRTFKILQSFFVQQKKIKAGGVMPGGGKLFWHVITYVYADQCIVAGLAAIGESYENKSSTEAKDFTDRYCDELTLSMKTSNIAKAIAEKMQLVGSLAGRSPLSAAAACIYLASHFMGEGRSPKEIAAVAQVSDGTIRTAYKLLHTELDKLIDPDWVGEGRGNMSRLPPV